MKSPLAHSNGVSGSEQFCERITSALIIKIQVVIVPLCECFYRLFMTAKKNKLLEDFDAAVLAYKAKKCKGKSSPKLPVAKLAQTQEEFDDAVLVL